MCALQARTILDSNSRKLHSNWTKFGPRALEVRKCSPLLLELRCDLPGYSYSENFCALHLDDADALISLLQTWVAKSKTSTPDTTSEPTPTTK